MKTIKLTRDSWTDEDNKTVFSEDFYDMTVGTLGEEVLCCHKLFQLFNVPKNTKDIWVSISNVAKKGWHKAKFVPDPNDVREWPALEVDGKTYGAFYEVENIMHANDIDYGDDFYFMIEY